ncbi:uncharacterized protein TNCV_2520511 [Trichonephila clavipes]|uniref:Uncharacterized protein n=1 Tax=Trichonephila clavipes TaxID=2585209 RepID=A0A8X6RP01_TRICX|nr:uncharacterized protein TNCV_2520511 [Trichonephila clavipes]
MKISNKICKIVAYSTFCFRIRLAIINSFILWKVNKKIRSLDQLTFRIALARQLTDGYSSRKRKRRPASFQAKNDETYFWLNGYVNKQNCRIWSEANPQVYVETPLHPEKLTVWCALWVGGIIGPYFFKNDEGHNVTVNGDWYRAMITNFFIPELNNHDVQEL